MTNWQQKYGLQTCQKTTPKAPKSFRQPDANVTRDFLRLVRITGICEWGLHLDDATILAELDANDLAELTMLERYDKQCWAQMLAYRLSKAVHETRFR